MDLNRSPEFVITYEIINLMAVQCKTKTMIFYYYNLNSYTLTREFLTKCHGKIKALTLVC